MISFPNSLISTENIALDIILAVALILTADEISFLVLLVAVNTKLLY